VRIGVAAAGEAVSGDAGTEKFRARMWGLVLLLRRSITTSLH
jgi:hypothetical protein